MALAEFVFKGSSLNRIDVNPKNSNKRQIKAPISPALLNLWLDIGTLTLQDTR